jgi:hypothetical protein
MALTSIADLWVPDIWIPGVTEKMRNLPSILNSGILIQTDELNRLASGAGATVNVPFYKDVTDDDDEPQVEDTEPIPGKIAALKQVAPILNRVKPYSASALSAAVSGTDPIGEILAQLGRGRLKRRQKVLIGLLRGAFGTAPGAAIGGAAPLSACRVDAADEIGNDATNAQLISSSLLIDALALLGELQEDVRDGAMLCHPDIRAALLEQDENSFERKSEGAFTIERYKGIPLFVSNALRRAGVTNGFVYDTYIVARGIVGFGEKPQQGDVIDVASMQYDESKGKNNATVYDRTRFLMHLNGLRWVGAPAGQSASNTELQNAANWQLAFQSADRAGAVCVRTNG